MGVPISTYLCAEIAVIAVWLFASLAIIAVVTITMTTPQQGPVVGACYWPPYCAPVWYWRSPRRWPAASVEALNKNRLQWRLIVQIRFSCPPA